MADVLLDIDDQSWYNFSLIGIVAQEPDYRMAWLLNTHLHMNFIRKADLRPAGNEETADSDRPGYSVFFSRIPFQEPQFRLIGNKTLPLPCIKESEGFDFILQISDAPSTFVEDWVKSLRKLPSIQWCGTLKNISNKSMSMLIFEDHEDTT